MPDVMNLIEQRRSIRRFKRRPVEREKILRILEAGRLAPSARNDQHRNFYVIESPQLLARMAEICNGQTFCSQAPAMLCVTAHSHRTMNCGQPARVIDAAIAMTQMMLMATELGLGTCWVGNFQQEALHDLLQLPEGEDIVAITPLGYPAEAPDARSRKALDTLVTYL